MSDRETLIADARKMLRELTYVTPARSFKMIDSLAGALAALAQVDEAKLAEVIGDAFTERRPYEGIAAGAARRAVERQDEWLRGGGQ